MADPGFFELALDRLRPSRRSVLRRADFVLRELESLQARASVTHGALHSSADELGRGVEIARPEQRAAVQAYAASAKNAAGAFGYLNTQLIDQQLDLASARRRGTSRDLHRAIGVAISAANAAHQDFKLRISLARDSFTTAEAPLIEMALNRELRAAVDEHKEILGTYRVFERDAGVTEPAQGGAAVRYPDSVPLATDPAPTAGGSPADAAEVAGARPSPPSRIPLHNEPRSGRVGRVPRGAVIRPAAPSRRGMPGRGPGNAPRA